MKDLISINSSFKEEKEKLLNNEKKIYERTQPKNKNKGKIALWIATIFTFLFMIFEIIGGWFAGSLAIMTDAAHLLTDIAAMLLSIFSIHLSSKPATSKMTFGYHRAEILGALASVVLIWALVIFMIIIILNNY
jgi:zinc transporter 2